jgi:hypothetical protein
LLHEAALILDAANTFLRPPNINTTVDSLLSHIVAKRPQGVAELVASGLSPTLPRLEAALRQHRHAIYGTEFARIDGPYRQILEPLTGHQLAACLREGRRDRYEDVCGKKPLFYLS